MNLHGQIMNLQTPAHVENYSHDARTCYKEGHRLARHAAAELALAADARIEELTAILRRIINSVPFSHSHLALRRDAVELLARCAWEAAA